MAKVALSTKRIAISKANAQIVGIVAGAAFVSIFCLMASRAVFAQNQYQAKVVSAKEKANNQLLDNLDAFKSLQKDYKKFDAKNPNVLDADKNGKGDNQGSNSKIILDALPSTYDFPALTSSIEKILKTQNLKISSITGTDDQTNQQGSAQGSPTPVEMPISFSVDGANYDSIQQLFNTLDRSIRPMQIDILRLSGNVSDMSATVEAKTYYQPGKSVNIKQETVK